MDTWPWGRRVKGIVIMCGIVNCLVGDVMILHIVVKLLTVRYGTLADRRICSHSELICLVTLVLIFCPLVSTHVICGTMNCLVSDGMMNCPRAKQMALWSHCSDGWKVGIMLSNLFIVVEWLITAPWENDRFISYTSWFNIFVNFPFHFGSPCFNTGIASKHINANIGR